jgi:aspartate kinase
LLATLSVAGIWTSWISTSQLRTSAVVPLARIADAVALLHQEFGLDSPDTESTHPRRSGTHTAEPAEVTQRGSASS